jgi:hypothetical protein
MVLAKGGWGLVKRVGLLALLQANWGRLLM